jgi:[FeFe] hydrogenase H-cluster maturation GTPase HydF
MDLNATPSSERIHIGIFGKRNAGKSSLINAITGQNLAIVSDTKGTTTDPVYKAMEILPLGPVMIIDTPGIDDESELGTQRVQKAVQVLNKTDIAILVIDSTLGPDKEDTALLARIKEKKLPVIAVFTKAEAAADLTNYEKILGVKCMAVSSVSGRNIAELRTALAALVPDKKSTQQLVGDLVNPGDTAVLVVPVDSAAPKGRLILPQQQVIRGLLDAGATAFVTQDKQLESCLAALKEKPKIIITDSQVFGFVAKTVPNDVLLTSFSILFARYKGDLKEAVRGVNMLKRIKDGDRILISEGCTHHRQCDDIGTVKLPTWIRKFTGAEPAFEWTSGTAFAEDLTKYKMIIHCGACMLNEKEMQHRISCAKNQGVPITNYGIAIAYINGILRRTLQPFPDILKELE